MRGQCERERRVSEGSVNVGSVNRGGLWRVVCARTMQGSERTVRVGAVLGTNSARGEHVQREQYWELSMSDSNVSESCVYENVACILEHYTAVAGVSAKHTLLVTSLPRLQRHWK